MLEPHLAINSADSRSAMGLLPGFTAARLDELPGLAGQAMSLDLSLQLVEDPDAPLALRFHAGCLLALSGDPRVRADRPAMVDVPATTIELGLPLDKVDAVLCEYGGLGLRREWIEKETPVYRARIDAFRIARYPVTNGEYRRFLLATGFDEIPSSWQFGRYPVERSNHPVYSVTPGAADSYAQWLSAETGRQFRLPSEAEWEYAAAGPGRRVYPWGDSMADDRANTIESGILSTTPVGIFPRGASCFGALDLAGNVEEFVADDYRPYPGGRCIDDELASAHGNYRIARGGSFTRFRDLARCTRRHGAYPRPIYVMGFRLAETPGRLAHVINRDSGCQ